MLRSCCTFSTGSSRPTCSGHRAKSGVNEGCEHFGHAFTGIEFERAWLERSHLLKNSELCASLQVHADRALGRLIRDKPVSELVAERLADCDPAHLPTMNEVARQLGLSERTLRRGLTQEHATFRNLAERAVIHEAKRRLGIVRAGQHLAAVSPCALHAYRAISSRSCKTNAPREN